MLFIYTILNNIKILKINDKDRNKYQKFIAIYAFYANCFKIIYLSNTYILH